MNDERWLLLVVLAIFILLGIVYSVTVPIFEAPDEVSHFFYIKHLVDTQRLPVQNPEAPMLWGQEGSQPPLYYVLAALIVSPVNMERAVDFLWENPHHNVGVPFEPGNKNYFVHTDKERWPYRGVPLAVHLARWFSLLLGVGTLVIVYRLVRHVYPEPHWMALAVVATVAFIPQFVFIHAAVSNDSMIVFTASLALLLMTRAVLQEQRHRRAFILGAVVGLAALSKLSGLALIPLGYLALYLQSRYSRRPLRVWLLFLLYTLGFLLVAGWWYVRNYTLYGDPTGLNKMLAIVGRREQSWTWEAILGEWRSIRWSFWGLFGWFNVPMSLRVYMLLDRLSVLIVLGWVLALARARPSRPGRLGWARVLLFLWAGVVLVSLIRWTTMTLGGQGRLLFPAIASIGTLLVLGWYGWWPRGWREYGAFALSLLLFTLAFIAPIRWIAPAYAKPPRIPPDRIPRSAKRVDRVFGGRIRLWAVESPQITVHPGDTVDITLYMSKVGPISVDYTLYLHLLGRQGEDVGNLNTFPGWGTYPTRLWRDGEVIVDHYRMRVNPQAKTPTLVRVEVGFYNLWTREGLPVTTTEGKPASGLIKSFRLVQKNPPPQVPQVSLEANFGNELLLVGMDPPPAVVHPGERFRFRLYWRALRPARASYTMFTHFIREGDPHPVAQNDKLPLDGDYPTLAWAPGETVVDTYVIDVPKSAQPGVYNLVAGVYQLETLRRLPLVSGPANPWVKDGAMLMRMRVEP